MLQAVSEKKTFKDSLILYMYIAQEQGQITPREQNFDLTRAVRESDYSPAAAVLEVGERQTA